MAKRPCESTHTDPRATEATCKNCWRAVHVRVWQRAWGLPATGEHEHSPDLLAKQAARATSAAAVTAPARPTKAPCRFLGAPTGDEKDCPTCSGSVRLKVLACELHGTCTVARTAPGTKCCATCPDHTLRGAERATPLPAPELPVPVDAAEVRAAFVPEFRAEVARCAALAYPEGRFKGRGIVIPAGGWKMLPGVFVTASMLRWAHVNSRLPVEVWYVGDEGEFDPLFTHITADLGVTWRDVSAELRRLGIERKERLHGWAVKPLALLLSSFEQVVMMDSDCYPVYDPERLWQDPRIGEMPAAFWPDNAAHAAGRPLSKTQWAAFGLDPVNTPGFESGQMLVDKRASWAALNVAAWLSDRMDYFDATRADRGRVGIHGDKELFSVAWNATRTPYHMARPVRFHEVAFLQHDPDGEVAFVHRCNDKPKIDFAAWQHTVQHAAGSSHNYRSTTLPHEHMVHQFIGELREMLRPNLPGFRDGTQDVQIWREVRVANVYRLPKRMDGMRVLDVGAHGGFFTHECCRRGAELVVAAEPFPANVALLRMNLAPWAARVRFHEAAVGAPGGPARVRMSGGRRDHTGEPHVVADGAGEVTVQTVALDDLIDQCGGRVDLLKIDAEGAEYPAILTAQKLGAVRRIAGEFHTHGKAHHPRELRAALEAAGFAVEMDESQPIGTFHATRRVQP